MWQKVKTFLGKLALGVSLDEQILFARHLSIMAQSGMSLFDSLVLLTRQAQSSSMKKILKNVSRDVNNGQFLSVALEPYRNIFSDLFINIINIGETSGTLPENLRYLSDELNKKKQLRSKVKGALVYPVIIFVGVVLIVSFLVFFIFPKILPIFKTLNVKLPFATRLLITVADAATNYSFYIIFGFVILSIIFWTLMRVRKVRLFSHKVMLYTPLLGHIATNINMASFCRTLGILLKSGVKIIDAISATAATLTNLVYRDELLTVAEKVEQGGQISTSLSEKSKIFPTIMVQMISVGENTGNLSETLLYLASFYEEEVDDIMKNLSTILEPALLIIMGVIVGFIAIAIITPIYGITQGLR